MDLPFFYDNSTRLMALGELKLGAKQNLKNFAVLNIGYGIASGLVIDGSLVKGNAGLGCLEALASGHRIAALGKQAFANNSSEILNKLCNGNSNLITAEIVAQAAKMGLFKNLQ